jgi:GGDEF domain-containing protein
VRGFNDAHGHLAGDELLTRLATRVESAMVGQGQIYRLGGVQLCALVPGTGTTAGAVVAAASGALDERGAGYAVVCRAVTVELPREAANVAGALRLADARLARYGHVAATRG